MGNEQSVLNSFGSSIEERIKHDLNGELSKGYPEVAEIHNLAGASTGYMRVYTGDRLHKACCLRINVMPGAYYFNMHIHPDSRYDVPRFGFEGMVTPQGSQVSMDIYPDTDLLNNIRGFLEQCGGLTPVWDEAKKSDLNPQPSRLPHMRALCSPYFLNFVGVAPDQLPRVEAIANQYFDVWLDVCRNAEELDDARRVDVEKRRHTFAERIIELDPDRDMVVQIYGEEVTQNIEAAIMFA